MDSPHKRLLHRACFIPLFFALALLMGWLGNEQSRPAQAANTYPTTDPGIENQAELDYTSLPANTIKDALAVIPNFSAHYQTSTFATFVEGENLSQVTYSGTGWTTLTCQYCSGGQYRRSKGGGNTAKFAFNGTSVSVILVGDARSGIVAIKIDNVSYPSINLFNNAAGAVPDPAEYVIATNLPPGSHTLQVTVTGQNGYEYRLSANQVGIDGFRYGNLPFGTLRGRVLDPDGDGIPGAWLSIASDTETHNIQAGSDGIFTLSGLPAGFYSVSAFAANYAAQTINSIVVTAGSETSGIDVTLPEAAGHTLFGRIYIPHSNSPAIQPNGTTLNINIKTGGNASGWSAVLSTTYSIVSLPIISASYDPITAWTLQAAIPAGTPAELYNLTVSSSSGTNTQIRAVRVVGQYNDPFYFVVLGDPQAATIEPNQPTFKRIVDEINLINPAFVLVVGDLVENATEAQFKAYQTAINRLQVPSYAIAGNHDFAHEVGSQGQIQDWGLWKKYFGRRYFSFDYGSYHAVGMDNSIIHVVDPDVVDSGQYFANQVAWVQSDLLAHENSLARFLFLHIIRQPRETDPTRLEWKPAWIDELHTNMAFYGHAGEDFVEVGGNTPVHWVETGDMILGAYRLVRVDHGVIGSYTYNGHRDHSIPSGNLKLSFSPANNGQNSAVTATVNNGLQEHFEHALIRFVMPRRGCYVASTGAITQLVHNNNGQTTVVYVTLNVPAASEIKVNITPCIGPDLALRQKVSANSIIAGNSLTYTLTITNNGPPMASGVTLTDTLPASATLVSAPIGNCNQAAGKIICQVGDLAQNKSAQVSLRVAMDPSARGTFTNTAIVGANEPDPTPQNDTASQKITLKTEANLSITQTALPNPVVAGDNLTFYLTVANNGPSSATGVILTDTLPASTTFVLATPGNCQKIGNKVICNLASLLPGHAPQNVTVRVAVDPNAKGAVTNLAAILGIEPDPDITNNKAQQGVTITDIYKSYLPILLKQ